MIFSVHRRQVCSSSMLLFLADLYFQQDFFNVKHTEQNFKCDILLAVIKILDNFKLLWKSSPFTFELFVALASVPCNVLANSHSKALNLVILAEIKYIFSSEVALKRYNLCGYCSYQAFLLVAKFHNQIRCFLSETCILKLPTLLFQLLSSFSLTFKILKIYLITTKLAVQIYELCPSNSYKSFSRKAFIHHRKIHWQSWLILLFAYFYTIYGYQKTIIATLCGHFL